MTLLNFTATRRAVEVLSVPQSQVIACLDRGCQPIDSFRDTDAATLKEAVRRLMEIGVLHELHRSSPSGEDPVGLLALTAKGARVARLIEGLGRCWSAEDESDE